MSISGKMKKLIILFFLGSGKYFFARMPDGGGRGRRHEGQAQRVQEENFPERPGVKVIKILLLLSVFQLLHFRGSSWPHSQT
jgi:hypothetical protein